MSIFCSFEGIDGTGKSTQAKLLKRYLDENDIPNILTREPGGSYLAEKIRNIIIAEEMDELTEFFLFWAARRDHILNTIKPNLDKGNVVLCDRFSDSTEVYQSNVDTNLLGCAKWQTLYVGKEKFLPDITFLLDIPVDKCMERLRLRGNLNRLDHNPIEFYEKARKHFLQLASYQYRFKIIDADKSEDEIHEEIKRIFNGISK